MKKTNTKRETRLGQKRAKKASKRKELSKLRKAKDLLEKVEKKKMAEKEMQEHIQKLLATRQQR